MNTTKTIGHLVEEILLMESFSSPHSYEEGEKDMLGQMATTAATLIGAKNPKIYNLNNGEKILSMHRNGAMELHHYPEDLSTMGSIIQGREKPNMRLISTAMQIAEPHLASGGTVSIPSSSEMHEKFLPLAIKIGKKYNWGISSHRLSDADKNLLDPMGVLPSMHELRIKKNVQD